MKILICKVCGNKFSSQHPASKYCSDKCRKEAIILVKKKYYIKTFISEERKCKFCDKIFITKTKSQIYCSKFCMKKYHREQYNKNANGIIIKQGIKSNYLSLRFKVFNRDEFKCIYCGRSPFNDNIKLEADHIYPESKGGEFILDNLVTACGDCNNGKRDVLLSARIIDKMKQSIKSKIKCSTEAAIGLTACIKRELMYNNEGYYD